MKMMDEKPTKSGLQALKMIYIMLFLFTIGTNCKYTIRPSAFVITSSGGDPGPQHEISFDLNYAGSSGSSTLLFPVNASTVKTQCPGQWTQASGKFYCHLLAGQSTLIPNAGEIVINDNDSFSSLLWNIREDDNTNVDKYTLIISSSEWKLSSNQCTPYEIKIAMNLTSEVKYTKCYSVNFKVNTEAKVAPNAVVNTIVNAEAGVGAEFGASWQKCAEWVEPPDSYVLLANVLTDFTYPNISRVISACAIQKIADKDGYGNNVFPYNPQYSILPDWITWDDYNYIAKPSPSNIGEYNFTFGVLGRCNARNLTAFIKVKAEQQFTAQSFSVDACSSAKLEVKNTDGNVALAFPPGASLDWINIINQTYIAIPKPENIGKYSTNLTVASPCGTKTVDTSIIVYPEKAYANVSYSVKACSSLRLTVRNAYGVSVPPSTTPSTQKTWIIHDSDVYIAKPTFKDIGAYNLTLSMFSYCGSRNITASISVTNPEDFLVNKKIIYARNTDTVLQHNLIITPSNKAVSCKNFSSSDGIKYNWLSINEAGLISLTPTGVESGIYSLTGVCSDDCGYTKDSTIEVSISNYADFLSSAGIALAAVVLALLF